MGHHLNDTGMRSVVSSPADYYYHRTSNWRDILKSGALAKRNGQLLLSVCLFVGVSFCRFVFR